MQAPDGASSESLWARVDKIKREEKTILSQLEKDTQREIFCAKRAVANRERKRVTCFSLTGESDARSTRHLDSGEEALLPEKIQDSSGCLETQRWCSFPFTTTTSKAASQNMVGADRIGSLVPEGR